MKALTYTKYGPPEVLALEEVERPEPSDDELLVAVHAASLNFADWAFVTGSPFVVRLMGSGLLRPKNRILGSDIAGRVEAVGKNVVQFRPGDEVFGDLSECGWGGFAEFVTAREPALAPKPDRLTFEEAAALPQAAVTALQALRNEGRLRSGQRVLVGGASGGIGTFAVQMAKAFGAEVTGVCGTESRELVRSIGADRVIDYTCEDLSEGAYDLIVTVAGRHTIFDYRRALRPGGSYVFIGGSGSQLFQTMFFGPWLSMFDKRRMGNLFSRPNQSDLLFVKELVETGKVTPVVGRRFSLSEGADAIRFYGRRHTRGKVVIAVRENGRR